MKKVLTKIFVALGSISKDKWEHFTCGMTTGAFFALVVQWATIAPVASAATLGLCKEIWDEAQDGGEFSFSDWLATALGGVMISVFAWAGALIA